MYSNNSGYRKRSSSKSPSRYSRKRDKSHDDEEIHADIRKSDSNNIAAMSMNMNMMLSPQEFTSANMGAMYPNMMITPNMMTPNMIPHNMMASNMITPITPNLMTSIDMMSNQASAMTCPSIIPQDMMANMMDGSMMGMYPNVDPEMVMSEEKSTIVLKSCKLTPPSNTAEPQIKRPRPPGCRTIFVGGLPDKITESIVREIFELYGHILSLRLSHKNFCHIRYEDENSVSAAMVISGYKLKLFGDSKEDEDDRPLYGFIHVDYAMSRDDQNEYKRKQRQALRLQRGDDVYQDLLPKGNGMEIYSQDRRSESPFSVHSFSPMAIVQISEKIKNEEQFASTLPTLIAWLEKGECSKKNSNQFYSMIQATNSHIRRLYTEKVQCDEDLQNYKERIKKRLEGIISALEQVAKVFNAAMHQRVWDHFTKPQRKNISTWQKMAQELTSLKDEFYEKFENEDMEFESNNISTSNSMSSNSYDYNYLKKENESLKFQLEAYKNEIDVVKEESAKEMEKFKAQFIARQALQNAMENKIPSSYTESEECYIVSDEPKATEVLIGDARLIGVISAFLQVHPQGASLDYVVSYVRALFSKVTHADVHRILQKYADVFERKTMGIGANIEHRWLFCAYKTIKN